MLYIIQAVVMIKWVVYLIRKYNYSLHAILCIYCLSVIVVDIPEVAFSFVFGNYLFHPHILSNLTKEIELGLIFADGIILPLTAVLFCHFAAKTQKHWRLAIIFAAVQYTLEWLYLKLGFLQYLKWNIWISIAIYLLGFRIVAHYSRQLLYYTPPITYFIRITAVTYTINAWITAGLIVPKISPKNKIWVFYLLAICAISFSIYAHWKGWLIYYYWSNLATILCWCLTYSLIILYDRWESGAYGRVNPQ